MIMDLRDALIVGAGHAGLSAALTLARQCHTGTVFDSKQYRTEYGEDPPQLHLLPGWDGRSPDEFRSTARREIKGYGTIDFCEVGVVSIARVEGGYFKASDGSGKDYFGRKVILAHGVREIYPDIKGYESCWGKGILYCLFCNGYDIRGSASSGVLAVDFIAMPQFALHLAHLAAQLTRRVTIYTNGNGALSPLLAERCNADVPWTTDDRPIAMLEMLEKSSRQIRIRFEDGSETLEAFIAHAPKSVLRGDFAKQLNIPLTMSGEYDVTHSQVFETRAEGVYAAGDCAMRFKVGPNAIASGSVAASGVATRIQEEKYGIAPIYT